MTASALQSRLLVEKPIPGDAPARGGRAARSVTVNLAESPLGWLTCDWERGQLGQRVTMSWDAAPVSRGRGGAGDALDLSGAQLDAKRRFEAAVAEAGPGLSDILWRVVCGGEGMREAESALGWPARAGKLVLGIALDRVADYYRIR